LYDKDFLKHYGVLGMRWGRRKGETSTPSVPKRPPSADHLKKVELKKKRIHEMTNAELKTINERLQLERQYKDLSKATLNPGMKFVVDLFSSTTKSTANEYTKSLVKKAMATAVLG
jgi:hypothetical protein